MKMTDDLRRNMWHQLLQRAKQYLPKMNARKKVFAGVSKSILNVDMFFFVLNIFLSTLSCFLEKWSNGQRKNGSIILKRGQGKGSSANDSIRPPGRWGCGVSWEWSEPHGSRVTSELQSTCELADTWGKEGKTWPVIVPAKVLSEVTGGFVFRLWASLPLLAWWWNSLTAVPRIRSRVKNVPRRVLSDHSMCILPIAQGHKGLWVTFVKHQQGL